ncbi:MAG: hypothetical protein KC613_16965, partial [Myxococcales bacterium]|nr:hypothetical protein [Myxococcales bacterium]
MRNLLPVGLSLLATTGVAQAQGAEPFRVVTVPWVATALQVPHDGVAGQPHYLQAVAQNCDQQITFRWDYDGDGTFDMEPMAAPNRWNLGVQHTYPAGLEADTLYPARVEATCGEQVASATFLLQVRVDPTKGQQVNRLISNGMWVGHISATRDAAQRRFLWRDAVDSAVFGQALLNRGHRPEIDPAIDPYSEDVRWIVYELMRRPTQVNIAGDQAGENADVNGNGIGIRFYGEENYGGGPQLELVASAGMLDEVVPADIGAAAGFAGRTFREIVEDGAEYFYWSQSQIAFNGGFAGGWDYNVNGAAIDSSQVGWAAVALFAAEHNAGIQVPQWVKDRTYQGVLYQSAARGGNAALTGGYGYRAFGECGANHARSGAMLNALGFSTERDVNNAQVQATVNYIADNFAAQTPDCWGGRNVGNYYAMYQIAKGMRSFQPIIETPNGVDWYDTYVDFFLPAANAAGRFTNDNTWMGQREVAHGLALLILIPSIFNAPPVAVAHGQPTLVGPGDLVTFDHSGSYHPEPGGQIETYRWNFVDYPDGLDLNGDGDFDDEGEFAPEDLDGDGVVSNDEIVWDYVTGDPNARPTYAYTPELDFGEEVTFRVVLQVTDTAGRSAIDDESVVVRVTLVNHPPVALGHPSGRPDAAYQVVPGQVLHLDARRSYDPDSDDEPAPGFERDQITSYGWDLNLDGEYDVDTAEHDFQVPGDWAHNSVRTLRLRVCDDGQWTGTPDAECEGGDCSLCSTVTVRINVFDPEGDPDEDGLTNAQEGDLGTNFNDPDSDDDGLLDGAEVGEDATYDAGVDTNPLDADTDDDGINDGDEVEGGTQPLNPDSDGDGLTDGQERGVTEPVADPDGEGPAVGTDVELFRPDADPESTTNPNAADTDEGGVPDGVEDANRDGAIDEGEGDPNNGDDDDPDGDGLTNGQEADLGTDPRDPDTDGDGLEDGVEAIGPTDALDADTDD